MSNRHAIFLINLLQDVNIIRPLVFMAARDLGLTTEFMLSPGFLKRDSAGAWEKELAAIGQATRTPLIQYANEVDAFRLLLGKSGVLVAASESNLGAHAPNNEIFRCAPASLLKITLQHGFECVGFLQNREHDRAHGRQVTFSADVVCGWLDGSQLTSMTPSQRPKLYVSGPPLVLQTRRRMKNERPAADVGLVCENLHSVRLNVSGDFKDDFITIFNGFCNTLAARRRMVTLRPHPGGQYFLKNKVKVPKNVTFNNDPMYKVDLSRFAYGISPPSSVVIDMVLAGIPVAVWRDSSGIMDASNYDGLTQISTLPEWLDFSREAVANPQRFLDRQQAFLERQQMPIDPAEVYRRFAKLFLAATEPPRAAEATSAKRERVMFVANGYIPTLQLSFIKPLAPLVDKGELATELLTEQEMIEAFPKSTPAATVGNWIEQRLNEFQPSLLVFCRYSGRNVEQMVAWARSRNVPVIYHLDDDILNIPIELGVEKHRAHNHPRKLQAVRHLLDNANLVYCSTKGLKERFRSLGVTTPMVAGNIYCSGQVLTPAVHRPARKVGYMGFDHAHDLATVVAPLVEFLRRHEDITFELFGSIPKPAELEEFGDRVVLVPPIRDYQTFLSEFAKREWDVAICPLAKTDFNMVKANTKWVEYSSVGAAVIASRGTIYDECCADGCGILAETPDEWVAALDFLVSDADARFAQVAKAQQRVTERFSVDDLRNQVLQIFAQSRVPAPKRNRIMFVATDNLPTLQLSFIKPLAPMIEAGAIAIDYLTVQQMKEWSAQNPGKKRGRKWVAERLDAFKPSLIVACRYNGPDAEAITDWARDARVPVIFHIDDDLLSVPPDIGEKHSYHNQADKLATVRHFLDKADLIYCSTNQLQDRLRSIGVGAQVHAGRIYCSGTVVREAVERPVRTFGYMASADHAHNLGMVMPAIIEFMRRNPEVRFELFGSIPRLSMLDEFGDRVVNCPPVPDYPTFLRELAKREWDIGICPLTPIPFNLMKANTKWVEYTSVGAAVIASRGTVYDECCADGCGILAGSVEEWLAALEGLTRDPAERYAQVVRAQTKLTQRYSVERLREQVLDVFERAEAKMQERGH